MLTRSLNRASVCYKSADMHPITSNEILICHCNEWMPKHAHTLRVTFVSICTNICPTAFIHSYSTSIFLFLTLTLVLTHTIKQSASDQSQCSLPTLSPSTPSLLCSLGCKHYPSNGSLEDTKTSSYLTPDTNLRALTVVYLEMKHTHTRLPELFAARRVYSRREQRK